MSGVRIHHPTLRACKLLVPHPRKDYHLTLDADGNTIVSETVWRRLQEAAHTGHGFIVLNEVPDPPDIVIGRDYDTVRTFRLIDKAMQELAPQGTTVRITRS